jgi:hypothetical protein
MGISGTDLLEVPTIYKAYFLGLNFREYTHRIWPHRIGGTYHMPYSVGIFPYIGLRNRPYIW